MCSLIFIFDISYFKIVAKDNEKFRIVKPVHFPVHYVRDKASGETRMNN